ncbi:hypothetical protein [Herminiimonas fonticola]|uniref:hypothetical protein n=1 Tax=Herminiimonas fonticola TaxID=303380 RepID=UPI0013C310CA|nr:hypothetical protein [Herminiimonas fonticola]
MSDFMDLIYRSKWEWEIGRNHTLRLIGTVIVGVGQNMKSDLALALISASRLDAQG